MNACGVMQNAECRIKNESTILPQNTPLPLISILYVCVGAGIARPPKIIYHSNYKR